MDPASAVLHYGQAMFEGAKAFRWKDGRIVMFRPDAHVRRMARGAPRLCMPTPSEAEMLAGLKELVRADADWVPSAPGTSLYLRPTLVATEAFLGVRPANNYLYFIIASPSANYYGGKGLKSVRIWVETQEVRALAAGWARPRPERTTRRASTRPTRPSRRGSIRCCGSTPRSTPSSKRSAP